MSDDEFDLSAVNEEIEHALDTERERERKRVVVAAGTDGAAVSSSPGVAVSPFHHPYLVQVVPGGIEQKWVETMRHGKRERGGGGGGDRARRSRAGTASTPLSLHPDSGLVILGRSSATELASRRSSRSVARTASRQALTREASFGEVTSAASLSSVPPAASVRASRSLSRHSTNLKRDRDRESMREREGKSVGRRSRRPGTSKRGSDSEGTAASSGLSPLCKSIVAFLFVILAFLVTIIVLALLSVITIPFLQ